jgi:glutaredoxin
MCPYALEDLGCPKKEKAKRLDFHDKAGFNEMVTELTQARNENRSDQQSAPQTQQVKDNINIVVGVARSELKDNNVIQCLAAIRYRNDSSSPYCDYTFALLNLSLFASTDIPRIKMQREDMASVLACR